MDTFSPSEKADDYDIVRPIGSGSFGQVYLVTHNKERRVYVMKRIRLVAMQPKDREATAQEVRLLQHLDHPNIVAYRDSFVDKNDELSIVMEYCEHGDLYNHLKKIRGRQLPEAKIIEWGIQVGLALHALHAQKILHRDLKTQNIFLSGRGGALLKLGDLGIAKVLNNTTDLAMTQIGTPFYMSPELFKSKPYSYKSDLWGLGCVLYEMAHGRHAFDAQSLNGLALKVLKDCIKALLSTNPTHRPTLMELLHLPVMRKRVPSLIASLAEALDSMDVVVGQMHALGFGPDGEAFPVADDAQGARRAKLERVVAKQRQREEELRDLEGQLERTQAERPMAAEPADR